ncbi:MAG: polyketide synthase, partial [Mycobacterium sp.]
SFLDAGVPPLSAVIALQLDRMNTKIFSDGRIAARVCMWVNKFQNETTVTASFPNNPIAHESVARYLAAMKSVYVRVAEGLVDRPSAIALPRAALQRQRL